MTQESVSPYQPQFERGGCGVGFVADQFGRASHALLPLGLDALINLQHRGALDADAKTGDGAGVLTPLPRQLFAREAERITHRAIDPDRLAIGVFFFEPHSSEACMPLVESAVHAHELEVVAWREVPIDPDAIGERAMLMMPRILQAIISTQHSAVSSQQHLHCTQRSAVQVSAGSSQQFELQLYLARKRFERDAHAAQLDAYVPSMSSRTIVYKGLLLAPQLPAFYLDLNDPDYEVPLVVFHQRYSTNTFPTWQRAQPFRVLCHNGEINTLQGNINWMRAREPKLISKVLMTSEVFCTPSSIRPAAIRRCSTMWPSCSSWAGVICITRSPCSFRLRGKNCLTCRKMCVTSMPITPVSANPGMAPLR